MAEYLILDSDIHIVMKIMKYTVVKLRTGIIMIHAKPQLSNLWTMPTCGLPTRKLSSM